MTMRVVLFLVVVTLSTGNCARQLNSYLRHYEVLNYDTRDIHRQHNRVRRSLDGRVSLTFRAHGRAFPLNLKRDVTTFSKNYNTFHEGKPVEHDVDFMYEGRVDDQPNSVVHGSIINGRFAGVIHTRNETFYIDKEEYHFKEAQDFHSVIYSENDVINNPYSSHTCGHGIHEIHRKMEQESHSSRDANVHYRKHNIYSRAANKQTANYGTARTCPLYLQTDSELWNHMKDTMRGSEDIVIKEEITALLATHVQAIRNIYEETNFDGIRGITFTIRRTRINTTDDCVDKIKSENNPFCQRNLDVSAFLNANSYQDHDDYCLAYVFTYRDFMGGTLGLAWVGSPSSMAGGVCEKHRSIREENGQIFGKSTNTGIVTLVNYNKPVVPAVSHLTFAHEVGHNFGSPHDAKTKQCQPYSADNDMNGNFIMFPSATSGSRSNNEKFSPCSIGNMSLVLQAVMTTQSGKKNCFVDEKTEFCGNGIREGDEECDCGFYGDCDDTCCYPRDDPLYPDMKCKHRPNIQCSPSEGSCCTKNCAFKNDNVTKCSFDTQCSFGSYCTGGNATCPTPQHKPDDTECNDNTQICLNGQCTGTICSRIYTADGKRWEACSVISDDREKMCHLGCKPPDNANNTCFSSGDKTAPAEFRQLMSNLSIDGAIGLPAGMPCSNFDGFCDSLGKCRGVDAMGPLARLKNLLFNPDTYNTIATWVTQYWWAVVLIIIGMIILMGGFIKICSVHTPSTNPNKPKARKLSQTLRRASASNRRNRNRAQITSDRQSRGRPATNDHLDGRGQARGRDSRQAWQPERRDIKAGARPKTQMVQRPEPKSRRALPSAPPAYGDAVGYDNRSFNNYEMTSQRI